MSIRPRTLLVVVILALLGAFAGLNWPAFTAPATLNLLFLRVEAPLGLTMLGAVAAVTLLYFLFAIGVETASLLETRRHARELEVQRRLADEAETSRFAELRRYLEAELERLHALSGEAAQSVIVRVDRAEDALKTEVERAGNTLAAYIGELEDRLTRGGPAPPTA
jgi:uncharacterized integral membrane protein